MATVKNLVLQSTPSTLVLPSGTTAQRDAAPNPGAIRYNSSIGGIEVYDAGGWTDYQGGTEAAGCSTIFYAALYGDAGTNADIIDLVSGQTGSLGGTYTRNFTQSGYAGLYVNDGYVDYTNHWLNEMFRGTGQYTLSGRRYWTIEWWCYNFGDASSGDASTMLEFNNYPHGILYRGQGSTVNHYWRGSPISLGNVTTGSWCHYALVGYGENIKSFNNGTQIADTMNAVGTSAFSDPFEQNTVAPVGVTGFRIGRSNHTTSTQYTRGVFRKFRVSLGCRYLSNFTSSTLYPIT